jgi:glycosyltransferase involved in cell wall biosynthesis
MRFAFLAYDLIPLRHPEWCGASLVADFKTWMDAMLPLADTVMAISRATAADVERYAAAHAIRLNRPVLPIPIGTGFTTFTPTAAQPAEADLPEPGSYVLFVSTIEPRKNHVLLFRVWRHLLQDMPRAEVPTLVFAGRTGWLVDDLMQQFENAHYLDGKIRFVQHPTDAELEALYRGCRFTVFPSLYEGWGLPVTESLSFGKPCVISNATSLPEAGGEFSRYFDPENVADATRVIRAVIEDPAGLAAWEARVVREFRPVSWDVTAAALIAAIAPDQVGGGLEPAPLV